VNKTATTPAGLVLFITGGGACWSNNTCNVANTASYLDGFSQNEWQTDVVDAAAEAGHFGFFDRNIAENPFRNYDFVYVPYCTGDMHAGNSVQQYSGGTVHHVGYANYSVLLELIADAFANADHVILAGGSAGSYGAQWNYDRTQQRFGTVPVHLVADSGPPFGTDVLTADLQTAWVSAWDLPATRPSGCSSCTQSRHDELLRYLLDTYPNRRFGIISSVGDSVVRMFMGFGFQPPLPVPKDDFETGLDNIAASLSGDSHVRVYYIDGIVEPVDAGDDIDYSSWHVFWKTLPGNDYVQVSGSNTELHQWLEQLATGDTNWQDVVP